MTEQVMTRMDTAMLEVVDGIAQSEGVSRAEVVRRLAEHGWHVLVEAEAGEPLAREAVAVAMTSHLEALERLFEKVAEQGDPRGAVLLARGVSNVTKQWADRQAKAWKVRA